MIEVPARIALLACKHLYHIAKIMTSHADELNKLSDEFGYAVTTQLTEKELNQALVSARIQESK